MRSDVFFLLAFFFFLAFFFLVAFFSPAAEKSVVRADFFSIFLLSTFFFADFFFFFFLADEKSSRLKVELFIPVFAVGAAATGVKLVAPSRPSAAIKPMNLYMAVSSLIRWISRKERRALRLTQVLPYNLPVLTAIKISRNPL